MNALLIVGTDTGVGKTLITALLAACAQSRGLSPCVFKPVQTGAVEPEQSDPAAVNRWLARPVTALTSDCFAPPVAPWVADTQRTLCLTRLAQTVQALLVQHELTLVEGIGGVLTPLAPGQTFIDLMTQLALPVVVVARPDLGTINHTLLTVAALQASAIPVLGVIVSRYDAHSDDPAIRSLPDALAAFLPVPVLAWVPPLDTTQPLSPDHPAVPLLMPVFQRAGIPSLSPQASVLGLTQSGCGADYH